MGTEHFSCREYTWHAENKDWRRARLITAGVDVGSSALGAAVFANDFVKKAGEVN